jgi:hypothetical protein
MHPTLSEKHAGRSRIGQWQELYERQKALYDLSEGLDSFLAPALQSFPVD